MKEYFTVAVWHEECQTEIETLAEYEYVTDSIEYTCPSCGEKGSEGNWLGGMEE